MSLSEQEMEQIATLAVEKILARMPDVIGNLMTSHAKIQMLNKEFYEKYPDFKANKHLVGEVLEQTEARDISKTYEEILEQSVPEIRKKMKIVDKLELSRPTGEPSRTINGVL